ncbi:MAG: methyltransferase domain-containing protein [Actinomycetes bacterium]
METSSPGERSDFYPQTLEQLLAQGLIDREMRILVVAGGAADRTAFLNTGFTDVTISNIDVPDGSDRFAPYGWSFQDAERLDYPDDSFDFVVVCAGLHHCASPHAALLEMYRVARVGLLAIESYDSFLMRVAVVVGAAEDYEISAVAAHDYTAAGVRNTPVPNYVYRWTEREIEKTIASAAPLGHNRFVYRRALEIPASVLARRFNPIWSMGLKVLGPILWAIVRVFPSQANLFAFAVFKPTLPDELFPWLQMDEGKVVPNEQWLRSRLRG